MEACPAYNKHWKNKSGCIIMIIYFFYCLVQLQGRDNDDNFMHTVLYTAVLGWALIELKEQTITVASNN